MFLKTATLIAIAGVALSLFLSLIQQMMFAARLYGEAFVMLSRLISFMAPLLLNGSLLLFLIAFLLSLKAKST